MARPNDRIRLIPKSATDARLDSRPILRFVPSMFSVDEALRFPLASLRGWTVFAKCGRCRRESFVRIDNLLRRDDRRILGDVAFWLRCKRCRSKPSAALLTNEPGAFKVMGWMNHETRKGPMRVLLWAER